MAAPSGFPRLWWAHSISMFGDQLTLVALPFILDLGTSDEPGFLPWTYGRNLLLLIAGVMAVAVVWAVLASVRAGRRSVPAQAG